MKQMIKRTGKRALLLLLAALMLTAGLPVLAAEDLSSQVSAITSQLEDLEETSSSPEEDPPESQPEESPLPSKPEGSEPAGGEDDPGEEEEPDEENPEEKAPLDASSLLVTGGHNTYLSGYEGALFKPDNNMSRGEVAYMFYNLLAAKPPVSQSQFSDVPFSSWWGPAINTVAAAGVFQGKGGNIFDPTAPISRAEYVTALSNCFALESGAVSFPDVEGHWAYPYIASAVAKGWITGFEDGTFGPDKPITRCQAVKIMNSALERRDEDFAKDRAQQKFYDVPSSHWAYLEIAEAAKPVDSMVDPPPDDRPFKKGDTVKVTADIGLNVRDKPNGAVITTVAQGTLLTIVDTASWPWVQIRMSNSRVGYVHSDYIELANGSGGDLPVTGDGAKISTGRVSLHQYQTFRLDASVTKGMDAMVWSSSDPSVAEVGYTVPYNKTEHGAMIYGKKPGSATLTFSDRAGTTKVSCAVTVTAPESVRYAYNDANTVTTNTPCNLVAVTDTSRSAVRFEIVKGPAQGTYNVSEYETQTRKSSYGLPDNTVRVFKKNMSFSVAGSYTLRAYSQDSSGAFSTDYKEFNLLVTAAASTTVTNETRLPSRAILDQIKSFEGNVWEIEDDMANRKHPTVGHGYVVNLHKTFYNTLTEAEAYALLVEQVNSNYGSTVNNFRTKYGVRMSQAQYDALVSFVYNCGGNTLNPSSYYTPAVILNAVVPPSDLGMKTYSGKLNVGNGLLFSSADSTSSRLATVPGGSTVTVREYKRFSSSTKQEVWYKVTYGSTTGWMPAGYVNLNLSNPIHDLNYVDSTVLAYNFLQWHTSSGTHYVGLLRRRLAECKIFFFGNYAEANSSHPNYKKNTYGFVFPTCCTS